VLPAQVVADKQQSPSAEQDDPTSEQVHVPFAQLPEQQS